MRRFMVILLLSVLAFSLCACGRQERPGEDASEAPEYYWWTDTKSSFPLGFNARINGVSASGDCVFLSAVCENRSLLARLEYSFESCRLHLGAAETLELPQLPGGMQILSLSYGAGSFYALFGAPEGGENRESFYTVGVYRPDGSLERSLPVPFADDETPKSILALDDGGFCLRSIHNIWLYTAAGELSSAISEYRSDIYPPLLIDGELIIQTLEPGAARSMLKAPDIENGRLRSLGAELMIPRSICQSAAGEALVNDGAELVSVSPQLETETVLDWYELTAEYGQDYRYICRLDENAFLMVPKDSGQLISLVRDYRPDERRTVRIGFYGQSSDMAGQLAPKFSQYAPDYRAECVSFGSDEQGLKKLLLEIGSGDKLDIVISEGWQLAPGAGFADLYPFIDKDPDLGRESFIPWMLEGLERQGRLPQIWSSFSIYTLDARGPLASAPGALKLSGCQDYLDKAEYEGGLFSSLVTGEMLLSYIAPNLLRDIYDENSGGLRLNSPYAIELLRICGGRPVEFQFPAEGLEPDLTDCVFAIDRTEVQPEFLERLESSGAAYRFFDGSGGGDNFTSVGCDLRACYMIPETCADKENAWGFLRTFLTEEWQTEYYAERRMAYPSNVNALETVLSSYMSEPAREKFTALTESAVFTDYDVMKLREILLDGMRPYLHGDCDLDSAVCKTESRLNIYLAEHSN